MQTRNSMRRMTMRLLALTLVAALVLSLVPSQTVLAQEDETTPVSNSAREPSQFPTQRAL